MAEAGKRPRAITFPILCLVSLGLAACGPAAREATRAGSALDLPVHAPVREVERDVPAPEVFSATESGLWDGRPSLGGVWVAHPAARDPERVSIRNTQTGAEVIGALFRRERENPGPRFQISSEAAAALGILAGQPTVIEVVALRLDRVQPAAAPTVAHAAAAAAAAAPAATDTPAAGTETALAANGEPAPPPPRRRLRDLFRRAAPAPADAPAIATTSLTPVAPVAPVAHVTQVAATAPQPEGAGDGSVAPAGPVAQVEPGPISPGTQAAPARRSLRDLFRRRSAPAAEDQPTADAALIPLPEPALAASSPRAAAVPMRAPAPQTAAATAGSVARPFVQIGIFAVQANATQTRARMLAAGLPAEIRAGRSGERDYWRVLLGPATDAAAQQDLLARARALGFADAYPVAR